MRLLLGFLRVLAAVLVIWLVASGYWMVAAGFTLGFAICDDTPSQEES